MSLVAGVLLAAVLVLFVPVMVLLLQTVLARRGALAVSGERLPRPRIAVLIPAHNEAAVIGETLACLMPQLLEGDRVLVVADNCSDDTAAIARGCAVEVVERQHLTDRGKGFALDFGVHHLAQNPPDVLLIVDADCFVEPGGLTVLAEASQRDGKPAQALYLMHAPEAAGLKQRVAEFAWRVKNQVRPLGWLRLGWPCQLMGTGMAFPWPMAERMALANASIVEDMKLGIDLALTGTAPLFCPQAKVTSVFPTSDKAAAVQRTRWEHGHLGMIVAELPRLLAGALRKRDLGLLGMALDLAVPPLALLVMLLCATTFLSGLFWLFGGAALPLLFALVCCFLLAVAVVIAWYGWGRDVVSLGELLSIPGYILAKIPIYLGFVRKRQKEWVRTDRE